MNKPALFALTTVCLAYGSQFAAAQALEGKPANTDYTDESAGRKVQFAVDSKRKKLLAPDTEWRVRSLTPTGNPDPGSFEEQWSPGRWRKWHHTDEVHTPSSGQYWEIQFRSTDSSVPEPPPQIVELEFGSSPKPAKATVHIKYGPPDRKHRKSSPRKTR
jgi:hypothetical protein